METDTAVNKHTRGKKLRDMTVFGYRFEVYENVVVFQDNEDSTRIVEMQHHTFDRMIDFYTDGSFIIQITNHKED